MKKYILFRTLLFGFLFFFIGCAEKKEKEHQYQTAEFKSKESDVKIRQVVARVNDSVITIEDLKLFYEENVDDTDWDMFVSQALEHLIDQELIAQEAQKSGYGEQSSVKIARDKALALKVAKLTARDFNKSDVSRKKLRRFYDANKNNFVHDVLRDVIHVLIIIEEDKLDSTQAKQAANMIYSKLQDARTEDEFRRIVSENLEIGTYRVENLPPFAYEQSRFVKEFTQAAFDVSYPEKRIAKPVETKFGLHVIKVLSQIDAKDETFEMVEDSLARRFFVPARNEYIEKWIENLSDRRDVFIYEARLASPEVAW